MPKFDDIFDRMMFGVLTLITVITLFLFLGFIYSTTVAETFALRKDEWECVSSHKSIAWTGKTPIVTNVCDNYVRQT